MCPTRPSEYHKKVNAWFDASKPITCQATENIRLPPARSPEITEPNKQLTHVIRQLDR